MGWRTKLSGGDEWDALTGWRRYLCWKPGERKRIKRKHNKRQRQEEKTALQKMREAGL